MAIQRLAIVGTGLIGASVGLAAKRAGVASVSGFDPDPDALTLARERGALDTATNSLEEALAGAELAVVAAPVADLPAQVEAALAAAPAHALRPDLGPA